MKTADGTLIDFAPPPASAPPDTSKPPPESTPPKPAASRLEENGFSKAKAGRDFDRIARAADAARDKGIGLLLSGPTGCGKTFAMRCLYRKATMFVSAFDPVELGWLDDRELVRQEKHIIIDDLGAEAERNQFGVWTSPLILFIMRASAAQDRVELKCRISVTTNLTSSEIEAKYGDRFLSRLMALTLPLRLTGTDNRTRHKVVFDGETVNTSVHRMAHGQEKESGI